MLSDATAIALVAAIAAILGPLLLSWMTNRNYLRIKEEEWERQDKIGKRIEEIHSLVNSNMTRVMQNELAAIKSYLAVMLLDKSPSQETKEAIKGTENRVAEISAHLADRKKLEEKMAEGEAA